MCSFWRTIVGIKRLKKRRAAIAVASQLSHAEKQAAAFARLAVIERRAVRRARVS